MNLKKVIPIRLLFASVCLSLTQATLASYVSDQLSLKDSNASVRQDDINIVDIETYLNNFPQFVSNDKSTVITDDTDETATDIIPENVSLSETYDSIDLNYIDKQEVTQRLGWIHDPGVDNLCHGYYIEPILFYNDQIDLPKNERPIKVSFENSEVSADGLSVFSGNVVITQPNRRIIGDITHLQRDEATGHFLGADLFGNVELREPGIHMVGESGHFDMEAESVTLSKVLYRFSFQPVIEKEYIAAIVDKELFSVEALSAWGKATKIYRSGDGVVEIDDGTYTTCPPTDSLWKIEAGKLLLNNQAGKGKAQDVKFYIKKTPILYLPTFEFPLNRSRKTGFLFPVLGRTLSGGYEMGVPIYWNIAPNYDATITPYYMSERGMQLNGEFRYLTEESAGNFHGSILPTDKKFLEFKEHNLEKFPPGTPGRSRLKNTHNTRYFISLKDARQYDVNWSSYIYLNRASDDYYFVDFHDDKAQITENQIINESSITYNSEHWVFNGSLMDYQTLHPLNQGFVNNQYRKLPELTLNAHYPGWGDYADFHFKNSLVNFTKMANPGVNVEPVTGGRLNINPSLGFPMYWVSGYVNPQAQLSLTHYVLQHQLPGRDDNITRIIPLINFDTGLYFDRQTDWFGEKYKHSLEPRLFYLYAPVRNQNDIPLFDTSLQPFTYDQLFRINRFTGLDRIGDANQASISLTSRFIKEDNGEEKLRASIGQIIYFKEREVNIGDKPTADIVTRQITLPDDTRVSPIVGEVQYSLKQHLLMFALAAWDPNTNITNNASFGTRYKRNDNHILNFSVNYIRGGDPEIFTDPNSSRNDLFQSDLSFVWPITHQLSTLGFWNYNVSHNYMQNAYAGFQYESCCWTVRLFGGRGLLYQQVGADIISGKPEFDTQVYLEVVLKGLGTLSSESPGKLLRNNIVGFDKKLKSY